MATRSGPSVSTFPKTPSSTCAAACSRRGIAKILGNSDPAPPGLSAGEKAAFESLDAFYKKGTGYSAMMMTRPQTLGYGLADSPAGQAAWIDDKFAAWTYSGGEPERALTQDEMLDDISLYWLTNSATSSAQLYWETKDNVFGAVDISIPVAVTVFPGRDLPRAAELGRAQLSQDHLLERGREGRSLRRPRTAGALQRGASEPRSKSLR